MAELSFHVEDVTEIDKTSLVKVSGAIDAKTVLTFQERLEQLQKGGSNRFILDMDGIKYVNSTGLGTLVNVADNLENAGGGIALVKIHPKVKVVFDMLGLNAFFKIFGNKEEAVSFFADQAGAGSARPSEAAPPPPAEPPPAAPVPAPAPEPEPVAAEAVEENKTFQVVCSNCNVNLTIRKAGSYKCPRCATFFKLDATGKAEFFKRKKAAPLQMKLSCTDECTEGLAAFINVLANRIGFQPDAVSSINEAVSEACATIIEKAYGNQQHLSYNVVITPSSEDLKIQFADYGKFLSANGAHFSTGRSSMDQFEHKQHPKGGNVISMTKKV